ncbi:MAG: hypothetical protein Q9160_005754 [Pyrenula sp. 1 TL-2023]
MSDSVRGAGPARGERNGGGGGSVRRARERAEAELLNRSMGNQIPTRPANSRPDERSKNLSPQSRRQAPMPPALSASRGNPATIGSAISRPAPMAQNWPLQDDFVNPTSGPVPPTQRTPPKGPPPQRPPRPKNVPSLLDSSKIQDYTPTLQYRRPPPPPGLPVASPDRDSSNYGDEPDVRSPNSASTPRTPSSGDRLSSDRPSTSSSVGSIPDFPVPAVPIQAPAPTSQPPPGRRNQGLGPPPVSRRPGTSYYSQSSFVSPIPEEMPEQYGRTGSYASSRVFPSSWGTQPEGLDEQLRQQRMEDRDNRQGLVRQASLGKKAKPALTTIKSSEDTSQRRADQSRGGAMGRAAVATNGAGAVVGTGFGLKRPNATGMQRTRQAEPMPTSPTFSSSSSSSSEDDFEKPPIALEEEVPLGRSDSVLRANPGMSERIPTSRRPPRLNMDAVKEAESRGSLTSLPDLIRRATKLASNLDRGKTASRLGMLDILNSENANRNKHSPNSAQRRSAGSMSDILASFPPPGVATPTGDRNSQWPSAYSPSRLNQGTVLDEKARGFGTEKQKRQRRRCCGMPLWVFIFLCLVILLLVAAAVVIPIVLIVIPRQRNTTPAPAAANDLSNCPGSTPCENGGVSVVSDNQCNCVCTNGFTGQRCTAQSDAACVAKDVTITDNQNMYRNATLGSSLPRLFDSANNNFSVPLNSSRLLSLFSANNLSCTSENALVTLNGVSTKKTRRFILPEHLLDVTLNSAAEKLGQVVDHLIPSTPSVQEPIPRIEDEAKILSLPDNTNPDRAMITGEVYSDPPLLPRQATLTSNGIVYAASSTPPAFTPAPPVSASSTAAPAPSRSPSPSPSSVGPGFQLNQNVFDFARVAVLFIFQKTVNAQEKLQEFFAGSLSNMTMPMNSLPQNFVIDFSNFTITSNDGMTVGGKGSNNNGGSSEKAAI